MWMSALTTTTPYNKDCYVFEPDDGAQTLK